MKKKFTRFEFLFWCWAEQLARYFANRAAARYVVASANDIETTVRQ